MLPPSVDIPSDKITAKHMFLLGIFLVSFFSICAAVGHPWYCMVGSVLISTACYAAVLASLMSDIKKDKKQLPPSA